MSKLSNDHLALSLKCERKKIYTKFSGDVSKSSPSLWQKGWCLFVRINDLLLGLFFMRFFYCFLGILQVFIGNLSQNPFRLHLNAMVKRKLVFYLTASIYQYKIFKTPILVLILNDLIVKLILKFNNWDKQNFWQTISVCHQNIVPGEIL